MALELLNKKILLNTNSFDFNGLKIYHTIKPKIKNSYIKIKTIKEEDRYIAKILLTTSKVSQKYILELLKEKESWIRKKVLKIEEMEFKKIDSAQELLLFGEIYTIDDFYKEYATEYLTKRLDYFSILMKLPYTKVRYKKLKTRWGSCNSRAEITLNTQLMKLEKDLIDYVVVHELAHLKYMNHSQEFHNLVKYYLDDEKQRRDKLKNLSLLTL